MKAPLTGALVALALSLAAAPALAGDLVLLRGAHVIRVAAPPLEVGDVLLDGARIKAVGRDLSAPRGATVIDARGKVVTPGLVETHSHLGVYPLPGVDANRDGNEATHPTTPEVRAIDSVDGDDPGFDRALMGGVTTVQILPGSANLIGGQSAILKIRSRSPEAMQLADAPRGMKMAMGENPKRVYGGRKKMPSTRMGSAAVLRRTLHKARAYAAKWAHYEESKGDDGARAPDRSPRLEVLADALAGEILLHVHCYTRNDILTLLRVLDEFGLKPRSLQHGLEAWRVAPRLAEEGIGVATFVDLFAYKWEMSGARDDGVAILMNAGVRTAVHTDHPVIGQRWLVHEAAKAMRFGLTREQAWRSITLHPAWILGLDGRVGSLEAGKDADVVLWSADPFSTAGHVERVWVDGVLRYDRARGSLR